MIEAAAHRVAATELALEAAREVEAHTSASAQGIAERISATERRRQKIRADLEGERIDEAQAGGLYGLADADLRDLAELHRAALEQVGQAIQQTREAEDAHRRALDELARAEAAERFAALTAHAAELDASLCATVAELAALARQAGRPANGLSTCFRPSAALSSMIRLGQIPLRSAS